MRQFLIGCVGLVALGQISAPAWAELKPEEIAILAIADSRESKAVAAYYAKTRQVPVSQILLLPIAASEEISREDWQEKVRPAIRRWLTEKQLLDKVRCLVTVWDVPLKISAAKQNPQAEELTGYLQAERAARVQRLNELLATLGTAEESAGANAPTLAPDAKLEEIKAILDPSFSAAQGRALQMQDEQQKTQALEQLRFVYTRAVGFDMIVQSLEQQLRGGGPVVPERRSEYDFARGRVLGLREGRAALEGLSMDLDQERQLLAMIEISSGLFGTIDWIDQQLSMFAKNETYSSFDSELSLVAWPEYQTIRWQPNYLHYRFDGSAAREFRKTFMVSRLEAPSLSATRKLIDDAIQVEAKGLSGKVYLDARGRTKLDAQVQPNSYDDYDQALLRADAMIRQHTSLEVVLDNSQELFAEGSCPQAALYCGWYLLANYKDAFDWQPGAIGYHMASSEATTLRKPESQVWCKRMLEDGVAATLGPTAEPYIAAFPRPDEFFATLLSGKYCLVETYYRCLPFTSWTMVLVGDPLYSPFKVAPPLDSANLDPALRRVVEGPQVEWSPAESAAAAPTPEES